MVVHGQSHVVAEQVERLEFAGIVEAIGLTPAQSNQAYKFAAHFERNDAFEKLGSNISIGA